MTDDGSRDGEQRTFPAVARARARLARIAGRELLIRRAWWVVGAGAAAAVLRPVVWKLGVTTPLWAGFGRAVGLFAAGSAVAAAAFLIAGRRRGPSDIGAARAVDESLGLSEVVASGFAFERDGRDEPLTVLARRHAAEAVASLRVDTLFPLPSLRPAWRSLGRFTLAAALAIGIGAYDRLLLAALLSPPTMTERDAASDLEEAAAELARQIAPAKTAEPRDPRAPGRDRTGEKGSPNGPTLADKAREAAQAARRGDRKGALEKLDDLRAGAGKQAARANEIGAALKRLAQALDPPKGKEGSPASSKAADPSASAEESMRLLAKKMRSPEGAGGEGGESKERMLERLERAGEEARRAAAGGKDPDASAAARALSKAAEALNRGDREAAAKALDEAASRAAAMEEARAMAMGEAMAIAEMLERSGALERAIQMALLGREGKGDKMALGKGEGGKDGKGGNGEGNGELRAAIMARLAAMGLSDRSNDASNGSGPHIPDRHRSRREGLVATGSVRAPSQVTEGARAIQAINGLGRGTNPPASYREVFPSYDAAAEEGIADEQIPAQRRAAVKRYFQAIRPDPTEPRP
jgi:hypothetical protein